MASDFSEYKELILSEINTLKSDFKEFRTDMYSKIDDIKTDFSKEITTIQVILATINTKLMVGSFLVSSVVGLIIAVATNMLSK